MENELGLLPNVAYPKRYEPMSSNPNRYEPMSPRKLNKKVLTNKHWPIMT